MRGEYLTNALMASADWGSPPLARGIQAAGHKIADRHGITPACAGNTYWHLRHVCSARDHPRLRGEYLFLMSLSLSKLGSPPLARGIPATIPLTNTAMGITPACAGNTILVARKMSTLPGSPPLARGIQNMTRFDVNRMGITPACAGNTLKKSLIYNLFPISISKFHLVSQTPEML